MRLTESYGGYIVEADPVRRGRRWAARVVFETREHGAAPQSAADEKLLEELRALGYLD